MIHSIIALVAVSYAKRLAVAVSLPAAIAHEVAHAVVALPWAEEVSVSFDGGGRARCHVSWAGDGPPGYASLLAAYAPLWIGGVLALVLFVTLLSGPLPQSLSDWLILSTAGAYWMVFVGHDPRDRGQQDGDQ